MKKPLFTKCFWGSFLGSLIGFVIAAAPLFWKFVAEDVGAVNSNVRVVIINFGVFSAPYEMLVSLSPEILLCSLALGVAAVLSWYESKLDGVQLGNWADAFSSLAFLGAIFSVILYVALIQIDMKENGYKQSHVKYLHWALLIFTAVVLNYFSSLLQSRRVKDLRG